MSTRSPVQSQTKPTFTPVQRGILQRQCASCGQHTFAGGECEECKKKKSLLQRRSSNQSEPSEVPPIVHEVLRSPGQPLDTETRAFMESRFGHDFSQVRVHTNGRASQSARAVKALAYTVGREVVFASGQYAPQTSKGNRLLAHELVHVLQQKSTNSIAQSPLTVNHPSGADEIEADYFANQIIDSSRLEATVSSKSLSIQRTVDAQVERNFQSDPTSARVCLAHLHADERNAFSTAQNIHSRFCSNLVYINNARNRRCVNISGLSSSCKADPNRLFTSSWENQAFTSNCSCPVGLRPAARRQLSPFRNQLIDAIGRCRGGSGGNLDGSLPVIAFHNNNPQSEDPTGLSIRSYELGGSECRTEQQCATEREQSRTGRTPNPTIQSGSVSDRRTDPDNFFLTTEAQDFTALGRAGFNVVLQSTTPPDDASLSVALRNARYINLEVGTKPRNSDILAFNISMAEAALGQLGIREGNCDSLQRTPEEAQQRTPEEAQVIPESSPIDEGEVETDSESPIRRFLEWLLILLREVIRVLEQVNTMPTPLPRETPPPQLPSSCLTFLDQAAMDARKSHWAGIIATMPVPDVVSWITGLSVPPTAATDEATQQKDCLLFGVRAAARRPRSGISLPSDLRVYGPRDFSRQRGIWQRKFEFSGSAFDRISDHARSVCGSLLQASETRWDPSNPSHRVCWNVSPLRGTTAPPTPIPSGARPLTNDERQAEILQASSAPGISRHHWGTDFDLFDPDMNPELWEVGQPFADEYSWLFRNASTYGFMQSFTAISNFMARGYMEERWHWSYWPIAQALLEFARSHQSEIETRLLAEWGSSPQFSFISRNWRNYMFNVSERPIF